MTNDSETPEPELTLSQRWAERKRMRAVRKKGRAEKKRRSKDGKNSKKR